MKKIIITLFILQGICSAVQAQSKNDVEFGANIGYNIAGVSQPGANYTSAYTSGFNLGASADYYFSERWSIKAKLTYDQKGYADGIGFGGTGVNFDSFNFKLNYLTVPVMANWHFGRTRNWYLNFGPYAGFLLSAQETSTNTDVKSAFNSTDFGLALGIGIKFPISDNAKLFIEDDAQAGLVNIFKGNSGSSLQNSRSSLNIGVNFFVK